MLGRGIQRLLQASISENSGMPYFPNAVYRRKGSAYLYLRNAFSLTRAAIFPGFDMAYWPGDQVNEEEENPSTRHGRRKGQTKF